MHKTALISFILIFSACCTHLFAQQQEEKSIHDSVSPLSSAEILRQPIKKDSIPQDSVAIKKKNKVSPFTQPVKYTARDSMQFDLKGKKVYLWGQAQIDYQDITLKADYIVFNMSDNTVFASGWYNDSAKTITGRPVFKQKNETFEAEELTYNFKTKKGYITQIKTEQDGGYLHSEITKRNANGEVNMRHGKFTTCDLDHPHFYLALSKAKVIPEDKIVSGPAYMVVGDVPLPIGIPFGFFPHTSKNSKSGFLIPAYGEDKIRGFKLQNGGFYWAINDYADAVITGDIYTRGSYGLQVASNYKYRYHFSGRASAGYYHNIYNDSTKKNDYVIQWSHVQDAKANPFSTFNASVNMSSSTFDRQNAMYNPAGRVTNTKTSSIMYSHRWPSLPLNMSMGMRHSQNNITRDVTMDLPSFSLNSTTIYPFRRKNMTGKMRWYENIQTLYSSSFENTVITKDSLLFTRHAFDSLNTGFRHSIPVSTNIKIGNFFNITPSINYTGMIYTKYIRKLYNINAIDTLTNTHLQTISRDTLAYIHGWAPSIGFTCNPKIYGMYQFRRSRIKAIRHVMSPTASFTYTPDMKGLTPDYYRSYIDYSQRDPADSTKHREVFYSMFEKGRYGTPTARGRTGTLALSLRNTLEMKILSKTDTGVTTKKVPILENFDFNTAYNPYAEKGTRKWSNINMNAGTRLFEGKYNIRMTALFNPYQYVKHEKLNAAMIKNPADRYFYKDTITFMYELPGHPLARMTNLTLSIGTSWRSAEKGKKKEGEKSQPSPGTIDPVTGLPTSGYVDFDIPWSLNLNYDFSYSRPYETTRLTQTIRVSGDFSLTKKWKTTFSSGYDMVNKKLSATTFTVIRDLHCWEMRFTCVPFGPSQMYLFSINVKAAMLRDLKYDKRQSWYDTMY